MKKCLYFIFFIIVIGSLSIWKHTQIATKYSRFAVEETTAKQTDFPILLTDGLTIESLTTQRTEENVSFTLTVQSKNNNVPFQTNDFALGFNNPNRGWDFSDFDPGETKINGNYDDKLQTGKNIVELTILNDPDSAKSALFYLGKLPNSSYKQIHFID